MADIIIHDMDDRALAALKERAQRRGVALDELVREIIETEALLVPTPLKPEPPKLSETERAERRRLADRMARIRAKTLKPLAVDTTLLIREDRDTR
jgi:hypothetical protein